MIFRVLSLFAGIGGFDLGLERTGGFRTVAFCEIDPFCRRVLAKHWPEVPCYDDVCTLTAERLRADGIEPDVICGGFPCQDISVAGKGVGLAGERSGLWREYARLIGEIRPRYVIVENVSALLGRGLGDVLGDLASIGYDAEWHCIPAAAVGAPHRRDRIWIVAYADSELVRRGGHSEPPCETGALQGGAEEREWLRLDASASRKGGDVCHTDSARLALWKGIGSDARPKLTTIERADWWVSESDVGRVANGVPGRVHRLSALGNAVVPQIPELIGRAILASELA